MTLNSIIFNKPPETFSSDRMLFRKPLTSDSKMILSAYAGVSDAVKYMSWPVKSSVDEVEDFTRRAILDWEFLRAYSWLCLDRTSGEVIGCAAFRPFRTGFEIGYILNPNVWGKGLGTELVKKLIEIAFLDSEVHRVWAYCDCENISSQKVLEKAGMLNEGKLRNWGVLPNLGSSPRDQFCYSMIREDL